jgi:hypothetical protein
MTASDRDSGTCALYGGIHYNDDARKDAPGMDMARQAIKHNSPTIILFIRDTPFQVFSKLSDT